MNRSLFPLVAVLALAACDAGFAGDSTGNRTPDTELAVRSTDLREDLGTRRLVSTVAVAWSGTDPDGVVVAFDVRSYQADQLGTIDPETGWSRTARRDSTLLLEIPLGTSTADVVVEVRSIDNEGAVDETPARTIFPILNSPPTLRLVAAETPADTTWPVVSFAIAASDRDGEANLAGIEVALNDTTGGFTRLPADVAFFTLVATDPSAVGPVEAEVYTGRGFRNSGVRLPGLRLDDENVVYVRSVDQAGATSRTVVYPNPDPEVDERLYVRRVTSRVLLVNDVRTTESPRVLAIARQALAIHGTGTYDEWDLSATPQNAANPQFSAALPATADPTLRQTITLWDRIYWVSNAVTNSATGNNLPRAASVMDLFFNEGGRILVQTPVTLPQGSQGGDANAAIDILPLSTLISFPPGVRALRAGSGTPVRPAEPVPGTGQVLPQLQTTRIVTTALPYDVGPDDIPLYRMAFYQNNVSTDTWQGSEVVASIRADGRAGLFALPLFSGPNEIFAPATPGGGGVPEALALLLDGLDFPTGSARLARR